MAVNSGDTLMGVTWWLIGLTTIAVGLRFYARCKGVSHIALDDWMMLVAWVLLLASQILLTMIYGFGLGRTKNLTMDQLMNIYKFQWIYVIPANVSSIFSRISIAILLARIFSVKKWFRWWLVVTTFLATCLLITCLVELWTSCRPISALWDPEIAKTAKCLNPNIFKNIAYSYQAILTLTDVTFVLFPVMFVWKLKLAQKKKIGLVIVFCMGILTAIASILKTTTVQSTSKQQNDIASTIPSLIWGTTEAALVIIMGCIPTLGPLTTIRFPNLSHYLRGSQPSTKSTSISDDATIVRKTVESDEFYSRKHSNYDYELTSDSKPSRGSMRPRTDSQASTAYLEPNNQKSPV